MSSFVDSLRGYSASIHLRDHYTCRYCGADGRKSFETWLTLSSDHLLPKGHPNRNNPDYIVTACNFCNTADNHYFEKAEKLGLIFDGKTPDELVAQRLPICTKGATGLSRLLGKRGQSSCERFVTSGRFERN